MQGEISDLNQQISQSEDIFIHQHQDFQQLNENLNDIYQKQSFAETKWYPDILQKVLKWSISMLDERLARDFTRKEVINSLIQNPQLNERANQQISDINKKIKEAK